VFDDLSFTLNGHDGAIVMISARDEKVDGLSSNISDENSKDENNNILQSLYMTLSI
jgi:hypothetical protein